VVKTEENTVELVNRILAGDRSGEEELVQRYCRAVSVIIRRSCGTRSAVEDLVQETFLTAITKIRQGDLRDPRALSGFICRIARNLTIMDGRRRKGHEDHVDIETVKEMADFAANPLDHVLRKEQAKVVRCVLKEVTPPQYRQVLSRYYIAQEDKESICADLGLASLQFNKVISRARKRFEELYMKSIRTP